MIDIANWRPVAGITLEPNALRAATSTSGNTVVTAGPGAGKTELLAQRADFLLRTGICPYPRRILAISFKVDAARNLRDRVIRRSGRQLGSRLDSYTFHAFAKRLIDGYRAGLAGSFALAPDYTIDLDRVAGHTITLNDLVPFGLEVLESVPYAITALRQTYSHVFLDEFQDATNDQYDLLKTAFLGTDTALTGVGDVKQRIMGFAGALKGVMKTCVEEFDAQALNLYQNFRAAPRLRRMQNLMIAEMEPGAESPADEIRGADGIIEIRHFANDLEEADDIAATIARWLNDGTPKREIAVLVRQQTEAVAAPLMAALTARGIPSRNDQLRQDLVAEPAAAVILDLLRVVADDRQPAAYADLLLVASRGSLTEEGAQRLESRLGRFIATARSNVRKPTFDGNYHAVVDGFLELLGMPAMTALSASYRQGSRLRDIIRNVVEAFDTEIAVDGDAAAALTRMSDIDAVRILTIHKCKGLEFERVVVLGVEQELFWGDIEASKSEYFVAISRVKSELILTSCDRRARPAGWSKRWDEGRTRHDAFLAYANHPTVKEAEMAEIPPP